MLKRKRNGRNWKKFPDAGILLNGKDIPDEMVLYEDTLFEKSCCQIQKVSETTKMNRKRGAMR